MSNNEGLAIDEDVLHGASAVEEDQISLRQNMQNLKLRDDVRNKEDQSYNEVAWQNQIYDDQRVNINNYVLSQNPYVNERRQRTMTEKGKEYHISILESRRVKLTAKLARKSSEIEMLLYSYQNSITVREELAQLNDIFKLAVDTHKEMEVLDDDYSDEIWFDDLDQKVFTFKHKIHNWLKESENESKSEKKSQRSSSSKSSKGSKISRSSRSSTREKAMEEKLKVAELEAEVAFMKKKREAEFHSKTLKIETELAKAQARAKVFDEEEKMNKRMMQNQMEKPDDINVIEGMRILNPKGGPVLKRVASEANSSKNKSTFVGNAFRDNCQQWESMNVTELLCKLVKEQSAPQVDLEPFSGNPLDFAYFQSMFREAVEKKIDDPRGRLTRLIKYTSGEARDLIKHFINDVPEFGYNNAMAILEKQYGDPHKLLASYRREIREMTPIKAGDGTAFRRLFNFLIKCMAMGKDEKNNLLDTPEIICMILSRLPLQLQDRWNRNTLLLRRKYDREPKLIDLTNFVEDEMTLVDDPLYSRDAVSQYMEKTSKRGNRQKVNTFATFNDEQKDDQDIRKLSKKNLQCAICKESHDIENCKLYLQKTLEERSKLIFKEKLCYGCLGEVTKDHNAKTCTKRRLCKQCNGAHPTTLHGYIRKKNKSFKDNEIKTEEKSPEMNVASVNTCGDVISMCVVQVLVKCGNSDKIVETYALLDNCSQGTFMSEGLMVELGAKGRKTSVTTKTLNGEVTNQSTVIEGLKVSKKNGKANEWLQLPKTFTKPSLPVEKDDIATPTKLKKWTYLHGIIDKIGEKEDISVGLLIGANCIKALEPIQIISSKDGGPYGLKTKLGWCIVGPVDGNNRRELCCNRIAVRQVDTNKVGKHYFHARSKVKETDIEEMLNKMYNQEFAENSYGNNNISNEMSQDDKKFMQILERETLMINGHYQIPLPFRNPNIYLPCNRYQAEKRLSHLFKKFSKNEKFKTEYFEFMENTISKGYARKAAKETSPGQCWYLPHHGVYHPRKPDKIRVVFDLSAEYKGRCLNRELLSGPDLTNQITGVLLRFREEQVAVMGDIEGMFNQVKVPDEHCGFLRFLWWDGSDTSNNVIDYEMTTHVFGGSSSPSCSNFALRKTAIDNIKGYGKVVAEILQRNFYVDDMLKSFETATKAIRIIKQVKELCSEGGFNLTKFTSNNPDVLKSIPEQHRRKNVKDADLLFGSLPEDKALGVKWNIDNDTVGFQIKLADHPLTRRGLLSMLSSIYDPLGLGAPFMLKGRLIIQQLCRDKLEWDDSIGETISNKWLKWKRNLETVKTISTPRCYKPRNFGKIVHCSLHHFSDASENGYGQASYLRLVNDKNEVHCCLVFGKSRVAPVKYVSIPRLELTAATLSVKISKILSEELDMKIDSEIFWTDSQVVLGYIKNENRRFKIFVANRVQLIRDSTSVEQWKYVSTNENPADDASRGLDPNDSVKIQRWFSGPQFLWSIEDNWAKNHVVEPVNESDPELKIKMMIHLTNLENTIISKLQTMTSNWQKMKRIMATVILIKDIWLKKIKKPKASEVSKEIDIKLLNDAEIVIYKAIQSECFQNEITLLKSGTTSDKKVSKSSTIYKLDPFIDDQYVLRVGGRLKKSGLGINEVHPVILPKTGSITEAIVRWSHECVGHSGRGMTLNNIRRKGLWVVNGNAVVRKVINQCVICRKLRGKFGEQKMADLVKERCIEAPPFTHCGVDMFGPFVIRVKRSDLKRYGALFTCYASRAVHIEVTNAMDADSFIMALRRFMARRGTVKSIRSDNGTNFIGANNELQIAMQEMDHEKIRNYLKKEGADWITWLNNPPGASHMGGIWERQIRSARNILDGLLKTHGSSLNDEGLRTLMAEAEAIINSRPLTTETLSDVASEIPLSPSNLLTMKSDVILAPPGDFNRPDLYSKRRWRRVQHIAREFWSRWRKEFLQCLQSRQKWNKVKRNFQINDVVLLKDDLGRNKWPMARITEVESDSFGMVRSVKLKVNDTILRRPINKIVLLVEGDADVVRVPTEGATVSRWNTS